MRTPSQPKEDVIEKLGEAFRRLGYEGATLAKLSLATGLQKASLYHYFPGGKEDMARAVLDQINGVIQEHVIQPLRSNSPPQDRLKQTVKAVDQFYDGGKLNCLIGIFILSASHKLFETDVRLMLKGWIAALAEVGVAMGVKADVAYQRAQQWVTELQGALIITRGLGSKSVFRRTLNRLPEVILGAGNAN